MLFQKAGLNFVNVRCKCTLQTADGVASAVVGEPERMVIDMREISFHVAVIINVEVE